MNIYEFGVDVGVAAIAVMVVENEGDMANILDRTSKQIPLYWAK